MKSLDQNDQNDQKQTTQDHDSKKALELRVKRVRTRVRTNIQAGAPNTGGCAFYTRF